jgi:DNA topoisomerase-1
MTGLVIVESPAKAQTISRILGKDYIVEASYGHVRDLPSSAKEIPAKVKSEPWSRIGVNVEEGYEPLYIVPSDKKKYVKKLKDALKKADHVLLATDEDREGESISWHVIEVLKPKVPVRRIAFHEITARAVKHAVEHPREIDDRLVRAQESRRVLDRLFGYELSPVLWKRVRPRLSAGRVQSVAVRLCVNRERERIAFRSGPYWDAEATLEADGKSFDVKLIRVGDRRVVSGSDFDASTGLPKGLRMADLQASTGVEVGKGLFWLPNETAARRLCDGLAASWKVASVEEKPQTLRPAPPFTTSSLQQEANRKLGFSAQQTMRIAQRLYEGIDLEGDRVGLITYMRTDSVAMAKDALADAQRVIRSKFGDEYTEGPRQYKTKASSAQEAHEAIRPTEMQRTPESLARYLQHDERRLYELIWTRAIASQMAEARTRRTTVEVEAPGTGGAGHSATFQASGKTIDFPGFLRAYVEGQDDPEAELADKETILPPLSEGQSCAVERIEPKGHETVPPARYTEASLVRKLEAEGIGRPSTYATIIETIQARGYVRKQKNALVPTFTAFAVTQLLEKHFKPYVELEFTARMESELDAIAEGKADWREQLDRFYLGTGEGEPGLKPMIESQVEEIDYPAIEIGEHPESGEEIVAKVGRYGPYLQMDGVMASLPVEMSPGDLTLDAAVELIEKKKEGPRAVGTDPETGQTVYASRGRYGPYVQLGEASTEKGAPKPKRASLPNGHNEDTVDLDLALKLLSLPRVLGHHPETGEEVIANVGRFGPYLKCGEETRSLKADQDDVYEIGLDRALEILAQPKRRRAARARTKTVLKELGDAPSGEGKLQVLDGPYGPYVTDGKLNASLPKDQAVEEITLDEAAKLLAEKGKPPKRGRRRKGG